MSIIFLQHFHKNILNDRLLLIVMGRQKCNLSREFKLKPITTFFFLRKKTNNNLSCTFDLLKKYYGPTTSRIFSLNSFILSIPSLSLWPWYLL